MEAHTIERYGPYDFSPARLPVDRTTEAAFWLAIADEPLDTAPRLIYADWLSERGIDELADILREWPGDYLPLVQKAPGVLLLDSPDFRTYDRCYVAGKYSTVLISTLQEYYRAIRFGLFRRLPIQRIVITDFVSRFIQRYNDGGFTVRISDYFPYLRRYWLEECEMGGGSLTGDGQVEGIVFQDSQRMAAVASGAFLRYARHASGLADLTDNPTPTDNMASAYLHPYLFMPNNVPIIPSASYIETGLHMLRPSKLKTDTYAVISVSDREANADAAVRYLQEQADAYADAVGDEMEAER